MHIRVKCHLQLEKRAYFESLSMVYQNRVLTLLFSQFGLCPFVALWFAHGSRLISLKGGILSVFINRKFQPL